ncbi:uncharacterized protein LOC109805041 [Cajanus cajan]|uniref:DUF668 domain-containing protein n=1 Tax=Cajanus cajan TaxID=3821 RepID=A0A151T159_CAJCA|nr:uncharacterized protein LOC109805041 [Cajanus cajan]KYP60793.1 hypothetical protein KK1_023206 [Cajanus cajan]
MVAENWIVKMGNQVSANLKHALLLEPSAKRKQDPKRQDNSSKEVIGILSFEVANVMSKIVHLHRSLSEPEIVKLRSEISNSKGVQNLVSSEEGYLLELARAEKMEELNRVAGVVSRLGKKCSMPALQGFEHVYGDIVNGVIDVKELRFLVKHMEGVVRKMDRYVGNTRSLYREMGVLNDLEQAMKKFQHKESTRAFEQKLTWQKQDVRHLKEVSLWNQNFDKVVELLARTVCTIYARICMIFGDSTWRKSATLGLSGGSPPMQSECGLVSGQINVPLSSDKLKANHGKRNGCHLGSSAVETRETMRRGELPYLQIEDFGFPCGTSPGRLFMDCLSLSSAVTKFDEGDDNDEDVIGHISSFQSVGLGNKVKKKEHLCHSGGLNHVQSGVPFTKDLRQVNSGLQSLQSCSSFDLQSRLGGYAPPSTLGGCALALHYANVITVIEKLLTYPHLVGEEARNDLYQMLPTSLRLSLKGKLKTYAKHLAIYDAPLAHDWKVTLDGILKWLAPLAHNMIRWQSERNFEQHQIVSRTNVLLFQTLYFADKDKTEEAMCQLLMGLNYICRYEQQQNALLGCASSFAFEDCMEWQLQCGAFSS